MALFPTRSRSSALDVLLVAVLLPLTGVGWVCAYAALWLCDRLCWPRQASTPPSVADVDAVTEYGWAQPPSRDR
jgi:hypothetical protein